MNRLERFYKMHSLFQRRQGVSLKELANHFELSESSIKRDIRYLRDFFNAPLIYDRQKGGYTYHPEATPFELPGFWLTPQELLALRIMQDVIDAEPGTGLSALLAPLKNKLEALLLRHGYDPTAIAQAIHVLPLYGRQLPQGVFSTICDELINRRVLVICYHNRSDDQQKHRRIHPQRLLHYRDNWYLVAFCELRRQLRIFSLDRITIIEQTTDSGRQMPEEEITNRIGEGFGLFLGKPDKTAVLRFFQPNARWIANETWHRGQTLTREGDDLILTLPYSDPTELVREILRQGAGVRVEAPEELRAEVIQALSGAISRYGIKT